MKKIDQDVLSPHARCTPAAIGLVVVAAVVCLAGCVMVSDPPPAPVTVPQVVELSKAGVPADEVIRKMQASGTVYRLQASQFTQLQTDGVPGAVIDYMQQTYLDAVARDASYNEWSHWRMSDDYWYGGVPFGWQYHQVYIIRENPRHERRERR